MTDTQIAAIRALMNHNPHVDVYGGFAKATEKIKSIRINRIHSSTGADKYSVNVKLENNFLLLDAE